MATKTKVSRQQAADVDVHERYGLDLEEFIRVRQATRIGVNDRDLAAFASGYARAVATVRNLAFDGDGNRGRLDLEEILDGLIYGWAGESDTPAGDAK